MSVVGKELLNAPFPELVRQLGVGIAEAQHELDKVSIRITQLMAGYEVDEDGNIAEDPSSLIQLKDPGDKYSLLGLGFTPTFYQFVDTVIELKMDVSMKAETSSSRKTFNGSAKYVGAGVAGKLSISTVNAKYSQKYQFSSEGSSMMRTKLVTVPAPAVLEELIRSTIPPPTGAVS